MPGDTIELSGIALEVDDPRFYLEVLSRAVKGISFYSPALRQTIAEALVHQPATVRQIDQAAIMRLLGFVNHELIAVLDREWQDYDGNEADRFFAFAASRQLFSGARSAFLWGAGACRLADYLGSLASIEQVTCSDISWPALYFGKALIDANYAALPELLTRARIFYHVEPKSTELVKMTKASRFKPPLTPPDRRRNIRYAVRDAFAAVDEPIGAELIVVPYLLDTFRADHCLTLLLRICQRIRVGQQIVVVVTCVPETRAGKGRDPEMILNALLKCGFKPQFLELLFLPYSFSYYSHAQMHTNWNTLVVRAERVAERDSEIVITRSRRRDPSHESHPDGANSSAAANRELVLNKLGRAETYEAMAAALTPRIGAMEFDIAVGELASRERIHLSFDANEPVSGG